MTNTDKGAVVRLREGDSVAVHFHGSQHTLCRRALLCNIPCATGDSWVFRDLDTGLLHHVSEGCTVTRLEDQTNDD